LPTAAVDALAIQRKQYFRRNIFRHILSSNNGYTWKAINNNLTILGSCHWLQAEVIFLAGTDGGGIYLSSDTGNNWKTVNNGLMNHILVHSP